MNTYLVFVGVLVLHPVEEAAVPGDLHHVHAVSLSSRVDLLVHRLIRKDYIILREAARHVKHKEILANIPTTQSLSHLSLHLSGI